MLPIHAIASDLCITGDVAAVPIFRLFSMNWFLLGIKIAGM